MKKSKRNDSKHIDGLEAVAGNGLIDRRALLGRGVLFAGAIGTGIAPALSSAAAEPLVDDPWSLGMAYFLLGEGLLDDSAAAGLGWWSTKENSRLLLLLTRIARLWRAKNRSSASMFGNMPTTCSIKIGDPTI